MTDSSPPVGIDLGTTFSVVAYLDNTGHPQTIKNSEGDITTPSVVFFEEETAIVGKEAVKAASLEPDLIAQFVKRDMGQQYFHKTINGRSYPPEVIQSMILKKLKDDAEALLGRLQDVVITVPAFFNEPRRKATQDAGRLAGLAVRDIINEPTAAAIAFGVQKGFLDTTGAAKSRERIVIYDLGGGTFDVTIMEIEGNEYRVRATDGNVKLGGIDWDCRIADYIAEQFMKKHSIDPREDAAGMQRLLRDAEDAKRALSARSRVAVAFEHQGRGVRVPITRESFDEITGDLLERTRFTVVNLLRQVGLKWSDVTRLMLVGGSTRMPMVKEMLEQVSGLQVDRSLAADEAVAHGAAIYAGLLRKDHRIGQRDLRVTDVNSHGLGVLGIEKQTGRRRNQVLIPANTPLPAEQSRRFKTHAAGQRSVVVNIVEGGDASGRNSTPLGKCVIRDLPPELPANTGVIVTFAYQTNGRLNVRARIPDIQKEARLEIQRASGMSESHLKDWEGRLGVETTQIGSTEPPPPPTPQDPGSRPEQLGEYRLLEKLAEGGMGTVYKAEHRRLKKTVALKILPAERMRDSQAVARFQREMEAAGRLDHPNIVRAMDAGEFNGRHFLVMEFVDGIDLDSLAQRAAPMPIADACELVRQAALGLQHAHEHGMVHRDLKPSNLMLTLSSAFGSREEVGVVKILDFGLARLRGQPTERMLTAAGQIVGTVDYMAPEQAARSEVDIRADIYSLGCTFYRLLAGRAPFQHRESSLLQTMMAHARDAIPPIQTLRRDVPDGLAALLTRMVAKDPAERYGAPVELAEALETFAQGHDLPGLVTGRPRQPGTLVAPGESLGRPAETEPGGRDSSSSLSASPSAAAQEAFDPQTPPDRALELYRQYGSELNLSAEQFLKLFAHAEGMHSHDEARQLLQEAQDAAQREDDQVLGVQISLEETDYLVRFGRMEEACDELRDSINRFPGSAELHLRLAELLATPGQDGQLPPECLASAARALELRPDDIAALRLASRASWHARELLECLDYAQRLYSAASAPEDQFEACLTMGLVYMEDEQSCQSAIEALETALELDETHPEVMSYLADCYWRQGRYDDSYRMAQRCLSISPDDEFCLSVVRQYQHAT